MHFSPNIVQVSQKFERIDGSFQAYNMGSGFQCTIANGLKAAIAKKIFKVGNRVSAYYPSLKASYTGVVSDINSDSGEIAVEFDPTEDEPEGSSATFKKPYSFLKKL